MIKFYTKNLKLIIPISIISILLLIVLTLSLKNNDIVKLIKISKEIVNINTSLGEGVKNQSFEYNTAYDLLQSNLKSFKNISSDLNNMPLKQNNSKEMRDSLLDYTNLNIALYDSALNILNNGEVEYFSNFYNILLTNEKQILKASNDLSNSKLDISFPKSANLFFISLNNYINTLYKSNREKDISDSQRLDFLLYTNSVVSDFSTLKEDLYVALIKIREDKRDLSILLNDINNKRSKFTSIKDKSYSISIPSNAQNCYASLEDMINSYEVYINSLESSVKSEIALNKENINTKTKLSINSKSTRNLEEKYSDTFDKYSSFISSFELFQNAISDYKNK